MKIVYFESIETRHSRRNLAYLNVILYACVLIINKLYGYLIGKTSEAYPTLITPAPFSFAIWGLIYLLLGLYVIRSCFLNPENEVPEMSLGHVRLLFSISCILNILWVILWTKGYAAIAFIPIFLLWINLLLIYIIVTNEIKPLFSYFSPFYNNTDEQYRLITIHTKSTSWTDYLIRRIPFVLYFAWTCGATVISIAIALSALNGGKIVGLWESIFLLSVIILFPLLAMCLTSDCIFPLVSIWTLIGLIVKSKRNQNESIQVAAVEGLWIVGIIYILLLIRSISYAVIKRQPSAFYREPRTYGTG